MAFVKKTWKDRIVQYANRRLLTKSGGEVEQVTVTRDEGTISEAGDQFNASNMNNLEQRIEDGLTGLTASDIEYSSGVTVKQAIDSNASNITNLQTNKLDKSSLKYIVGTGTTDANGILTATAMGVAQLDYDHHIILAVQSSYNGTCVNVGQYNKNFYFVCTSASGLANPIANTNLTIRIIYMDKWW